MSLQSKSNPVHETTNSLFPSASAQIVTATADAAQPIATSTEEQRTEQMYQLAEIFALIFEALPDGYEHAIATTFEET